MKILDDADGLRLNALMTAYPKTAMTTDGPITMINKDVKINQVSANIDFPSLNFYFLLNFFSRHHGFRRFFNQDRAFIGIKSYDT